MKMVKTTIKDGNFVEEVVKVEVSAAVFVCPHCGHRTTGWGSMYCSNEGHYYCPECGKCEK